MSQRLPGILCAGLRLPVIAAPMFLVSTPELVVAQSVAGVVGSFPALNARTSTQLREWLTRIAADLDRFDKDHPGEPSAPFAVNLIVHRSNDRLDDDLAVLEELRVPIVITSLGARADVNDRIHAYGGIVLHDVVTDRFARKAIEKGADGLIAVAVGAGGHGGALSPFALLQEIRAWFDGPVALSGAIAHGSSILAAQAAGADLAYVGSLFIATEEAAAGEDYKRMIIDSTATDIVYTDHFTGVHGNYLSGSILAAGLDPARLSASDPTTMSFASDRADGPKPWRDIWGAGQGIGTISAIHPTADVVDRLLGEYRATRDRLATY
ncbi:NAD(P)H-dependent flavin oxidoreductase [Nocardia salmonicida]|uniref:NAD(P)H-dependent flavin oxidoreductase n=1 Tax=Nocardia salmonicida TaxID=53431 RepID=UPI0037A807F1